MTANSIAQISRFDELSYQMLFNVPIYQPDTLVLDFIRKYLPHLTEKPIPGGWTIHPPLPESEFYSTIHSMVFKRHPYFETVFAQGRFDILCSELRSQSGISIEDFHLWFMFDTKQDADIAFQKLSSMFDSVSKNRKVNVIEGKTVAEYSESHNPDELNTVQLILTEDELSKGKFKLYFKIGTH